MISLSMNSGDNVSIVSCCALGYLLGIIKKMKGKK